MKVFPRWDSQVNFVKNLLQTNSSVHKFENLTINNYKTVAEMFLYLNTCPNSWFKSWFLFYNDLFKTQTTDQILLTLNRMMKINVYNSQAREDKIIAEKLFSRATNLLPLKYQDIQRLFPMNNGSVNGRNQNPLGSNGNIVQMCIFLLFYFY